MKRSALIVFFLLTIVAASAQELLVFNKNHFTGWIYTRDDIELNKQNISANRIALYGDFTLVSPIVNTDRVKSITVKVKGYCTHFDSEDYNYNPYIGSPFIELLDANNNVLKSQIYRFTTTELVRDFEVDFDISDIADGEFKLRLACWDADMASSMSASEVSVNVKEVILSGVPGDVDNDGTLTAGDVTALYNWILNNDDTTLVAGDQDGDGSITSGDVTVVYNLLLGNN